MKSEAEVYEAIGELEQLARNLGLRMQVDIQGSYQTWLRLRQVEAGLHALRWVLGGEHSCLEPEEARDGQV